MQSAQMFCINMRLPTFNKSKRRERKCLFNSTVARAMNLERKIWIDSKFFTKSLLLCIHFWNNYVIKYHVRMTKWTLTKYFVAGKYATGNDEAEYWMELHVIHAANKELGTIRAWSHDCRVSLRMGNECHFLASVNIRFMHVWSSE